MTGKGGDVSGRLVESRRFQIDQIWAGGLDEGAQAVKLQKEAFLLVTSEISWTQPSCITRENYS